MTRHEGRATSPPPGLPGGAGAPPGATPAAGARRARRGWQRVLLFVAGSVALVLAALGVVLPLLPTTPLVILAGFFFARGSERAYGWLLRRPGFGRIVREWEQHRRIPKRAKRIAIALVIAAFALSASLVASTASGYLTFLILGSLLVVFLARLPTSSGSVEPGAPPT